MKTQLIQTLTADFESFARRTEAGVEFWLARDLQQLLGYGEWRNFEKVIEKAKEACQKSGQSVSNHFVDANKKVFIGSGAENVILDMMLTRYACYHIAHTSPIWKIKFKMIYSKNYHQ